MHLEASEAKMNGRIIIPANIPLTLIGDGGSSCIRGKKRTISQPQILLRGPSRTRIRDIEFQHGGKEKNGLPASPVADILIDNADQEHSRISVENSWISGIFADRLQFAEINLFEHYSASYGPFLRTSIKVLGPEKPLKTSRVAMFSGVVIGNQIQAHVLDGGQLLMRDFWHEENAPMTYPWALLAGKGNARGNFILQSASIYQQSKKPIIEVNSFDGNITAISNLILGHSQYIEFNPLYDNTSFLSLFGCLQLAKHSKAPKSSLWIDKVSPYSKKIDPRFY